MAGRHWTDYLPPGTIVDRLEQLRTLLYWYNDVVETSKEASILLGTLERVDLPSYTYLKQNEFVSTEELTTLADRYEREHPYPRTKGPIKETIKGNGTLT